MTTEGQRPGIAELIQVIAEAANHKSREYTLIPNPHIVIDKYTEMNNGKEALGIYQLEQDAHPEIFIKKRGESKSHFSARKNIKAQMAFIQNAMTWHDGRDLAAYLGAADSSKVLKKGYHGPMKAEAREDFLKRLRGMFTITSILERYLDSPFDKRAALAQVNGLISDVRVKYMLRAGKTNTLVCITTETVRQFEEAREMQRQKSYIGAPKDTQTSDTPEVNMLDVVKKAIKRYAYVEAVNYQANIVPDEVNSGRTDLDEHQAGGLYEDARDFQGDIHPDDEPA
jgi:hypothetical protein